jgi:hypothetical protein
MARALTTALTAALVAAAAGTAFAAPPATPEPPRPAVAAAERPATDVIVQWRAGTGTAGRDTVRRAVGLTRRSDLPLPATELAAVPPGASAEQLARRLAQDPRVAFAEADAWLTPSSDDPRFPL